MHRVYYWSFFFLLLLYIFILYTSVLTKNDDNNVTITEIRTHTNFSTFKYFFSVVSGLPHTIVYSFNYALPPTNTYTHTSKHRFRLSLLFLSLSLSRSFDLSHEITAERADAFLFTVRFSLKRAHHFLPFVVVLF